MNTNNRALILAAVALLVLIWLLRYDLQTTTGGGAFRLDRWSGHIDFIRGDKIMPAQTEEEREKEKKREGRDLYKEFGLVDENGNLKAGPRRQPSPQTTDDKWLEQYPVVKDEKWWEKDPVAPTKGQLTDEKAAREKWNATIEAFLKTEAARPGGTNYRKDQLKLKALDKYVRELGNDPKNQDKPMLWFLTEAHKKVLAEQPPQN